MALRPIRVMIADNNVELCRTIEEFLNMQGDMEVAAIAHDGKEALEKMVEATPDVLVLDITMPNLDGMAVLERMGTLNLEPRPAVIVLTAMGREDIIQRFTDLGAEYFIIKPFDLDLLAERIRQFASGAGTAVAREPRFDRSRTRAMDDASIAVTQLLHRMGVPPNFKGYNYLRDGVLMVLRDAELLGGALTKRLYPELAEKYKTTPGGVEAAIRNAVLACYERGNREFINELCGHGPRAKRSCPTNSMVIAKLADHVRLSQRIGQRSVAL